VQHRGYIGIGSNQGAKLDNCTKALEMIAGIPETRLRASSSFFDSEPWGHAQEWYVNGAVAVDTNLEPQLLLDRCQVIERDMGRRRTAKRWEDRIIDLDLLFFDDLVIDDPWLEIPHPELHKRKFVLVPMCEIAPEVVHPVLKMSIVELLARTEDAKQVVPILSK
jgi:2-amino-4-hydroxy-6-hydroxymethyldihydropteridine diphosphokinase